MKPARTVHARCGMNWNSRSELVHLFAVSKITNHRALAPHLTLQLPIGKSHTFWRSQLDNFSYLTGVEPPNSILSDGINGGECKKAFNRQLELSPDQLWAVMCICNTDTLVKVLRWSALALGLAYGFSRQSSITARDKLAAAQAEYDRKAHLISQAKYEWQRQHPPPQSQQSGGDNSTLISSISYPNVA